MSLDPRIVTRGNQRSHVDHFADVRPAADGSAFAALGPRIVGSTWGKHLGTPTNR